MPTYFKLFGDPADIRDSIFYLMCMAIFNIKNSNVPVIVTVPDRQWLPNCFSNITLTKLQVKKVREVSLH